MSRNKTPLLYSFRRCPYAIRARMAIWGAGIEVELTEVTLKNKPEAMLKASPKGTVPVLCLPDRVIDESLDIMRWALKQNDPHAWIAQYSPGKVIAADQLIQKNDLSFKPWLDRYKYAVRYPEHPESYYRDQCGEFLSELENSLRVNSYLLSQSVSFADVAIFPFVRQFSMVDASWFACCEHSALRDWLQRLMTMPLFKKVMDKKLGKY